MAGGGSESVTENSEKYQWVKCTDSLTDLVATCRNKFVVNCFFCKCFKNSRIGWYLLLFWLWFFNELIKNVSSRYQWRSGVARSTQLLTFVLIKKEV